MAKNKIHYKNLFFTCSKIFNMNIKICSLYTVYIAMNVICAFELGSDNKKVATHSGHRAPVALACQKVFINPQGNYSAIIAKITVVNYEGQAIYNKFVKPLDPVIDYRTSLTGITAEDLNNGDPYFLVRRDLIDLLGWRIVVGHKVAECLKTLKINIPLYLIRDTAYFKQFFRPGSYEHPKLKSLAKQFLNTDIEVHFINTTENAITAMNLYKKFKVAWDKETVNQLHASRIAFALNCKLVEGVMHDQTRTNMVARVSIVDYYGFVVYDRLFKSVWPVVDYHTNTTGLQAVNFTRNAVTLCREKERLELLLKGNVLVGYGLLHDLTILGIKHQFSLCRDAATFTKFKRAIPDKLNPSLNELAKHFLNKTFDVNPCDSVQQAHIAMLLYINFKSEWDKEVRSTFHSYVEHRRRQVKMNKYTPVAIFYSRILMSSQYGNTKVLGRVTVVNENHHCIYDKFIKQRNMRVVDCYTNITGIHPIDVQHGITVNELKKDLRHLLDEKIIVGYNLKHFFLPLRYKFNMSNIREISIFKRFRTSENSKLPINIIAEQFLNTSFVGFVHPVAKARIFMSLYFKYKDEWDMYAEQLYTEYKLNSLRVLTEQEIDTSHLEPISMQCSSVVGNPWDTFRDRTLARIVFIDKNGQCIYDNYIKKYSEIIDFNRNTTGINPDRLFNGTDYFKSIFHIYKIINKKIIIGEEVYRCFRMIQLKIRWWLVRDIAFFSKFKIQYKKYLPLNEICKLYLGYGLNNPRDPIERAKAMMRIYLKFRADWELEVVTRHEKMKKKVNTLTEYVKQFHHGPTESTPLWL